MENDHEVLYREVQRFRQPLIWIFLISIALFSIYGMVQQLILGKPFGNKQYSILAHYFSHSIFKSAKEPNISATGLDKITEIKVEHISKRMKIQCQSLLLSNDIFCSQESLKP